MPKGTIKHICLFPISGYGIVIKVWQFLSSLLVNLVLFIQGLVL